MRVESLLPGAWIVATLALGGTAQAAVISTAGCASAMSCTLAELGDGGSITVGDVVFGGFMLNDGFSDPTFDADDIRVTGFGDATTAGLIFDAGRALTVRDEDSFEFSFEFDVTVAPAGRTLVGALLGLDDADITGDAFVEVGAVFAETLVVSADAQGVVPTDTATLANLVALAVAMDLQGEGFDDGDAAALKAWRFGVTLDGAAPPTPIPVPAAAPLLVAALAGLALLRRRSGAAS